jgi:hypothetical protein
MISISKLRLYNNATHEVIGPHQWHSGQRDCLECGRLWVRAPVGSNQRL